MKPTLLSFVAVLAAQQVAGHATWQELWVNGVDEGSCVRLPPSNSPVTDVTSTSFRCNVNGATGVSGKCSVVAGQTVTIEMHQQPGDRSCANEAIGGDHYGPVNVFLTKVTDASTADGSTGWFKIFQDTWSAKAGATVGSSDNWGTIDLNNCCGRMNVKIPSDIPAGDYLMRAEVIALHVAGSLDGAQFYMSCYQLTVTGGGSASPGLVQIPGMYAATDPGILIDIYESLSTYIDPGPTVYSGGTTKSCGAGCTGVESGTATGVAVATTGNAATTTAAAGSTMKTTTSGAAATSPASGGGSTSGCTAAKYAQCGGTGYTGCTTCASGSTCSAVSPPYYSQCV